MPRYFTLAEARALLPPVGRTIREAVQAKGRYEEADKYLHDLGQRILMQGGMSVGPAAEAWKGRRDNSAGVLRNALAKFEELGIQVKDLDAGLLDFPTLYHGQEVYLCWRMDEADIEYWHGVHEGFAGRKAIDPEFVANHMGEPT